MEGNRPRIQRATGTVDHLAVRILDQFGLDHPAARRWEGMKAAGIVTNHEFAEAI